MRFEPTEIPGLFVIESASNQDNRGSFCRIQCRQEFEAHGLIPYPEQSSLSYNRHRGTVRGLHFQEPPFSEAKLVTCVGGSAFDAVVDLRRASPMFGKALWFNLDAKQTKSIYVPEGCAHGFQTLADETTLLYMISTSYQEVAAKGVRWNDPEFDIPWPIKDFSYLSERDKLLPMFSDL